MNCRSHSIKECVEAQNKGMSLWQVDTGSYGDDDMVIYPPGTTRDQVVNDVIEHHDLETLPPGWTVTLVDFDIA